MNKPLFFISLSLCAGIITAAGFKAGILFSVLLLLVTFCAAMLYKGKRAVLAAFFSAGMLISSVSLNYRAADNFARLKGTPFENCTRTIVRAESIPDESPGTITFIGSVIETGAGRKTASGLSGKALIKAARKVNTVIYYGDIIEIRACASVPVNENEKQRLYLRGIDAVIRVNDNEMRVIGHWPVNFLMDLAQKARIRMIDIIYASIPLEQARLCEGLLMGSQRMVPDDRYDEFIKTGTVHILAVSGANVAVICITALVFLKFAGVNRALARVIAAFFVWLFCCATGASESVVRASIMASFLLAGPVIGRDTDPVNSLSAAAFFTAVISPLSVLSYSFQMSYLAAFGIIYMSEWLDKKLAFFPEYIRPVVTSTLAAQLFVMPVIINGFGRLSLVSFIANLVIVPVASLITVSGFFMWIAGLVSAKAGMIFGASCFLLAEIMTEANSLFAAAPWAMVNTAAVPAILYAPYYAALFTLPHEDIEITAGRIRLKPLLVIAALLLVVFTALSETKTKKPQNKAQTDIMGLSDTNTAEAGKWK